MRLRTISCLDPCHDFIYGLDSRVMCVCVCVCVDWLYSVSQWAHLVQSAGKSAWETLSDVRMALGFAVFSHGAMAFSGSWNIAVRARGKKSLQFIYRYRK